jgi:hypothetical protein
MCNVYSMTATADEMRALFGPFEGDRDNVPAFENIFPNYKAPRRNGSNELKLEMMTRGFPGASGGRRSAHNQRSEPEQPLLAIGVERAQPALPRAGDEVL